MNILKVSTISPALDNTTCASMDLLMLDEQTVPKDNLDCRTRAEGGGMPGGVEGRCRPTVEFMAVYFL